MSMIWLFTVICAGTVLVWQESFLGLWVVHAITREPVMLAIVLMVLQFALIRTDANIIDLTLSLQRKVVLGIVSAALSWRSAGSCSSRSTGASEDWSWGSSPGASC